MLKMWLKDSGKMMVFEVGWKQLSFFLMMSYIDRNCIFVLFLNWRVLVLEVMRCVFFGCFGILIIDELFVCQWMLVRCDYYLMMVVNVK